MAEPGTAIRPILFVLRCLLWMCSVVVLGLTAWAAVDIKNYRVIFPLSISVITIVFYIPAIVLALMKRNHGYMLPMDIVFSFLWLSAFIFLAQHIASIGCHFFIFSLSHGCAKKNTAEAFTFLTFFFILCSMCLEIWNLYDYGKSGYHGINHQHEKHPPVRNGDQPATAGAAPTPHPTPQATDGTHNVV